MVVGILQVELEIDGCESLKEKRRVIASVKDRLHHEHQVSVAEVAQHDNREVAVLGIAMASSDARYCQSVLDSIVHKLGRHRDCVLGDYRTEILTGQ